MAYIFFFFSIFLCGFELCGMEKSDEGLPRTVEEKTIKEKFDISFRMGSKNIGEIKEKEVDFHPVPNEKGRPFFLFTHSLFEENKEMYDTITNYPLDSLYLFEMSQSMPAKTVDKDKIYVYISPKSEKSDRPRSLSFYFNKKENRPSRQTGENNEVNYYKYLKPVLALGIFSIIFVAIWKKYKAHKKL